jgi:hypothetical protein
MYPLKGPKALTRYTASTSAVALVQGGSTGAKERAPLQAAAGV